MRHVSNPQYPISLPSRMTATEALFWYAEQETPRFRPVGAALLLLDQPPDLEQVRASLERLIFRVPRVRHRVVESPLDLGRPEWEDDPYFDLDYHLRSIVLPAPGNQRQLLEFVSSSFATPLDALRPLWEAHLIEGLEGGKAAFFLKAHSCLVATLGTATLIEALTQGRRRDLVRAPAGVLAPRTPRPGSERLMALVPDALHQMAAVVGAAIEFTGRSLREPRVVAVDAGRTLLGVGTILRELGTPGIFDPLAGNSEGIGRRLEALTFPLPRLQRLSAKLGVSSADLMLMAVAGALGRYHDDHDLRVGILRCLVLTSASRSGAAEGGASEIFAVNLPVGEPSPRARLERVRRQTKAAQHARLGAGGPLWMHLLSPRILRLLAGHLVGRVQLSLSQVEGPSEWRYLAESRIEAIHPFAPVIVGAPFSVALLTYGDKITVGIDTDPAAIPDAETLHRYLEEGIKELGRVAARSPAAPRTRSRQARARIHVAKKAG